MYSLESDDMLSWWKMCREKTHNEIEFNPLSFSHQRGKSVFGYTWLRVPDIPCIECYRYLAMKGYKCNASGEIALDSDDAAEYISFQHSLMEG